MTAWQTALRRDSSSAEVAMPELAPVKERLSDPSKASSLIVLTGLVQKLAEQAYVAYRWLRQKGVQRFSTRRMRVSETVALGEKRFVTIIDVDGTQLLIGSAAGQVSLLAILDEQQNAWRAGSPKEQNA